jgi:hypothetical protein
MNIGVGGEAFLKLRTLSIAIAFLAVSTVSAAAQRSGEIVIDGSGVFINRIFSGAFTVSGAVNDHGTEADTPDFTGHGGVHITRVMTMSGGEQITLSVNGSHAIPGARPSDCPQPSTAPGETLSSTSGGWSIESGTGRYSELRGSGQWVAWVIHNANGPRAAKECLTGRVRNAP